MDLGIGGCADECLTGLLPPLAPCIAPSRDACTPGEGKRLTPCPQGTGNPRLASVGIGLRPGEEPGTVRRRPARPWTVVTQLDTRPAIGDRRSRPALLTRTRLAACLHVPLGTLGHQPTRCHVVSAGVELFRLACAPDVPHQPRDAITLLVRLDLPVAGDIVPSWK